nr:uncharacterized protein LOC113818508 [Penaeus vannamei]
MYSQKTVIYLMMAGLCLENALTSSIVDAKGNEPEADNEWPFLQSFLKESLVYTSGIEEVVTRFAKHLTQDERFRLENAAMELVLMIQNNNLRLYGALSDLYMIKKVIYPHLDEQGQDVLDRTEEVILSLLQIFGVTI